MSNSDLDLRRQICVGLIKFLDNNCKNDPRYEDARKEYVRQLTSIESKITAEQGDVLKPPPTVVNLKSARLMGKGDL